MPAMLMKTSTLSLTEQLAARFAERIRNRLLAPGARLPSVRQCAQQHSVSPSTVVAAYDQLLAQGLVEARKNRGFFVREAAPAAPTCAARRAGTRRLMEHGPLDCHARCCAGPQPVNATALDPRHVPPDQRQAAAGHGGVSA
jgi:DNA-binding transcriptional regulator YhcF (GntR family)